MTKIYHSGVTTGKACTHASFMPGMGRLVKTWAHVPLHWHARRWCGSVTFPGGCRNSTIDLAGLYLVTTDGVGYIVIRLAGWLKHCDLFFSLNTSSLCEYMIEPSGRWHGMLFECTDTLHLTTSYLSWHSGKRACQTPRVVRSALYQALRPAQEAERVKCPLTGAAQILFGYCAHGSVMETSWSYIL